jgi:hypothetical protein
VALSPSMRMYWNFAKVYVVRTLGQVAAARW